MNEEKKALLVSLMVHLFELHAKRILQLRFSEKCNCAGIFCVVIYVMLNHSCLMLFKLKSGAIKVPMHFHKEKSYDVLDFFEKFENR